MAHRAPVGSIVVLLLFVMLLALRVPSLGQPAGGDQGLYGYVAQRILDGGLPYRDAWDQKPPAIHYTYALMLWLWPHESVVPAADLVVAGVTAVLLVPLARALAAPAGAGHVAALLYVFLANPSFARLAGARIRAQCEVFIELAVVLAMLAVLRWHRRDERRGFARGAGGSWWWPVLGGIALGGAILYKYNAGTYALPLALVLLAPREHRGPLPVRARLLAVLVLGLSALAVVGLMVAWFRAHGALDDLYQATIRYNLAYSEETYSGPRHFLRFLLTFPVNYARVDSLWWLGGLGCVWMLARSLQQPVWIAIPASVLASCITIAVNGSRGYPQYFLQAYPALAIASGVLLTSLWHRVGTVGRIVVVGLTAFGIWRVSLIPKMLSNTVVDTQHLLGRLDEDTYLARFGTEQDKYSGMAVRRLARYLQSHTAPGDFVYVFGFSQGALMNADRVSSSRFIWSRPILYGFNEGRPGYGAAGLLADLQRRPPKIIALQRGDFRPSEVVWNPAKGTDSASFFLKNPGLSAFLAQEYEDAEELGNFLLFARRTPGA